MENTSLLHLPVASAPRLELNGVALSACVHASNDTLKSDQVTAVAAVLLGPCRAHLLPLLQSSGALTFQLLINWAAQQNDELCCCACWSHTMSHHRWSMDDMMTAYVALQEVKQAVAAAADVAEQAGQPASLSGSSSTSCSSSVAESSSSSSSTAFGSTQASLGGISHVLDLGCGIGSVLLMVAWGLRRLLMEQQRHQQQQEQRQQQQHQEQQPKQQQQQQQFPVVSIGIEAQDVSYKLAVRNIKYNVGPQGGVQVRWLGDRTCNYQPTTIVMVYVNGGVRLKTAPA